MTTAWASGAGERHRFIVWAAGLSAINGVLGVVFAAAWPGLQDRVAVIVVSIVLGVLFVAAAWWAWNGSRRGAVALLVVNAVNALLSIPGFFTGESANIIGGAVSLALSAAAMILLWNPEARSAWNRRG